MGLITGLFTWPVAPVRGVSWIAEQVLEEAERQWADPAAVERGLADIDAKRESGELSDEEAIELEEELVARLTYERGGQHE
jgi:predicted transcriptional regulator